jgi:membrane fusion protein, multidrug efflux system
MTTRRSTPLSRRTRIRLLMTTAVLVVVGLVILGIVQRRDAVANLRDIADEDSLPQVQVISPTPGPETRTMTLPGTIKAWYSAPIYAQVSGYVHKWYKDYGAPVRTGDLLATVQLGLNLGQTVQVTSGLKRSDRLIINPSAGVLEGQQVRIVQGVPGIAPEEQFRVNGNESKNLSSAQRAKVEAARNEDSDK